MDDVPMDDLPEWSPSMARPRSPWGPRLGRIQMSELQHHIDTGPAHIKKWFDESLAKARQLRGEPKVADFSDHNMFKAISTNDIRKYALAVLNTPGVDPKVFRGFAQESILIRRTETLYRAWDDIQKQIVSVGYKAQGSRTLQRHSQRVKDLWGYYGVMIIPRRLDKGLPNYRNSVVNEYNRTMKRVNLASAPLLTKFWDEYLYVADRVDSPGERNKALQNFEDAKGNIETEDSPTYPPPPPRWPAIGFGTRISGIQGNWQAVGHGDIGGGSFGQVSSWIRHNENGDIVQAMAVKECSWRDKSPPHTFVNPDGTAKIMEIHCHEQLQALDEKEGVVLCHGSAVYEERALYRLYLELAGRGDLSALISAHSRHRSTDSPTKGVPIPPQIVWAIFEALAVAANLFKSGRLPGQTPNTSWQSLIHLDLKPANVFLATKSYTPWPVIRGLVGDLGLMMPLSDKTFDNPENTQGVGTLGHQAPEQMRNNGARQHGILISTATDIYAMGLIMIQLVTTQTRTYSVPFQMHFHMDQQSSPFDHIPPELEARARRIYGNKMINLIQDCTFTNPDERIEASTLYRSIQKTTGAEKDWFGDGDTTPMRMRSLREQDLFLARPDTYVSLAR